MESFVPFDQVNTSTMRHDDQYDFSYPSQHIERHYRDMLRSICPVCGEEKISLSALNRHTTMEHQLSYCDLCIRYARVGAYLFSLLVLFLDLVIAVWIRSHETGRLGGAS